MPTARISIFLKSALLAGALLVVSPSAKAAELVDINHAPVAEMLKVPGMTLSWANRIVRFRPYRTKLDLVETGIIPPVVYQRLRKNIIAHHAAPADGSSAVLAEPDDAKQ